MIRAWHLPSARVMCSTPFGTTYSSPGRSLTDPSRTPDLHLSTQDEESFIRGLVHVPDEIALQLHDLELVVIELGDDARGPVLLHQGKLCGEIDR